VPESQNLKVTHHVIFFLQFLDVVTGSKDLVMIIVLTELVGKNQKEVVNMTTS